MGYWKWKKLDRLDESLYKNERSALRKFFNTDEAEKCLSEGRYTELYDLFARDFLDLGYVGMFEGEEVFCATLTRALLDIGIQPAAILNDFAEHHMLLPDLMFDGCDELKEIFIPQGIPQLRDATFSYCSNLKKITLPGDIMMDNVSIVADPEQLAENCVIKIQGDPNEYPFDRFFDMSERHSGYFRAEEIMEDIKRLSDDDEVIEESREDKRKKKKEKGIGWFQKFNAKQDAGIPEVNIAFFNHAMGADSPADGQALAEKYDDLENIFGMHINGTISDFDPETFVEKARKSGSLHTNRIITNGENYKEIWTLVIDITGTDPDSCHIWIDVIKETWERFTNYDADTAKAYEGEKTQDRIFMEDCGEDEDKWDKAVKYLEDIKRTGMSE